MSTTLYGLDRFRGRRRGNERVTSLRQRFEEESAASGTPQAPAPSPGRTLLPSGQRMPLRDRLAMLKARLAVSSAPSSPPHSPWSSSSSSSLSSAEDLPPATPSVPASPVCPPAPRKPRAGRDIRAHVSAERLRASCCDDDDIILDRRANSSVGDCDDWFVKELPCLPLALRLRTSRSPLRNCVTAPASLDGLADEDDDGSLGPEMRRHLHSFWDAEASARGEPDRDGERLKAAYLNGVIDGTLADHSPGMVSVIEENRRKSDEGRQDTNSVDVVLSYLYGAIDQEIPAWESDEDPETDSMGAEEDQ